jgi:ABC-type phosphate/phosphonate transport system substrate-binding protein
MYDAPDVVRAANDRLWTRISGELHAFGLAAPGQLDRMHSYDEYWLRPDLLLAQACGFPYVKMLRGKVHLVATPVYRFPGGEGMSRSSFVLMRENSGYSTLETARGAVVAINDPMSNSGMNLLRALVAPLAREGRFFSRVEITGGHRRSIAAVREGRADLCSIDSVTYGLLAEHAPAEIAGLKMLAETPAGPGLPLITRGSLPEPDLAMLRQAISTALDDPAVAEAVNTLGLVGLEVLPDSDYDALVELETQAVRKGYPTVA